MRFQCNSASCSSFSSSLLARFRSGLVSKCSRKMASHDDEAGGQSDRWWERWRLHRSGYLQSAQSIVHAWTTVAYINGIKLSGVFQLSTARVSEAQPIICLHMAHSNLFSSPKLYRKAFIFRCSLNWSEKRHENNDEPGWWRLRQESVKPKMRNCHLITKLCFTVPRSSKKQC